MASAVRVLAMDAMEPTANVTKTSVLVTKKNNAVLKRLQNAQHCSILSQVHLSLSHLQLVPSQLLQVHGQQLPLVHPLQLLGSQEQLRNRTSYYYDLVLAANTY